MTKKLTREEARAEILNTIHTEKTPKKRSHGDRAHAPLSPSSGKRWGTCPGSLWLSRGIVDEPSEAAKEGTIAHEWVERLFEAAQKDTYAAELAKLERYDEEMAVHCDSYIEFLDTIKQNFYSPKFYEYEEYLEQKIRLTESIWGTLDWSCVRRKKKAKWQAVISDFKYGRGTYVPVKDNWQMIIYLLCLQKYLGVTFEKARVYVYQPRYQKIDDDRPYEHADLDEAELKRWGVIIAAAEKKALATLYGQIPPEYVVGDHCQFCPAQTKCTAFRDSMKTGAIALLDDDPETLPEVEKMPTELLIEIHQKKKQIEHFLENVDHTLLRRGMKGDKLKSEHGNLKIVESRGRRKWIEDEEKIAATLREHGLNPYKKKLVNIGEVERKIGKGELDDLTEKPPGKLQLVSSDDPRKVARLGKNLLHMLD